MRYVQVTTSYIGHWISGGDEHSVQIHSTVCSSRVMFLFVTILLYHVLNKL